MANKAATTTTPSPTPNNTSTGNGIDPEVEAEMASDLRRHNADMKLLLQQRNAHMNLMDKEDLDERLGR